MSVASRPTETEQPRGLTPEQIARFQENGFLKIGKLLDDDLVELLRREYDREFAGARRKGDFRNLAIDDTEDVDKKNRAPEQMLQIMQMCERNIHFRRLLYHAPLLDVAASILGPNLQLFHDQALYKPARQGAPVFWHQDNAYWQCRPANLISCWMTLDDVDVSNGAMQFIPGSHRSAVAHERSQTTSALLDLGDRVDGARAEVIELPAGGALIHHCQTLHYTGPNTTGRQRRAFIIHYMTPGTQRIHTGEYIPVTFRNPMLQMRI